MTVVASGVGFMGFGLGLETDQETRSVCAWLHERASATIDAPGLRRPRGGDCRWWPWLRCRVGSGSNRRKGKMTRRRSKRAVRPLPAVVARARSSASARLRRCVGSSMTYGFHLQVTFVVLLRALAWGLLPEQMQSKGPTKVVDSTQIEAGA